MNNPSRLIGSAFAVLILTAVAASLPKRPAQARPPQTQPLSSRYDPTMSQACEKTCAVKLAFKESELSSQPDPAAGALARCPVSGVVFRVREEGAGQLVDGRRYRFCCASCGRRFRADPGRFLSAKS